VAAHEVGHVLQHHQGYLPLQMRSSMAPAVGFASTAAWPLFIVGLLIGPRMAFSGLLMDLGIAFFAGAVLFHIITLPVEFDASKRALVQLTNTGAVMPEEVAGAKQVLDAAALTYVAAAAMAALQLLRLIVLRNDRR
jgi:Zn-dependent membrane protease YugP